MSHQEEQQPKEVDTEYHSRLSSPLNTLISPPTRHIDLKKDEAIKGLSNPISESDNHKEEHQNSRRDTSNLIIAKDSGVNEEDIKPVSCPNCNQRFTRLHNLKSHMMIHTDLKSFHCSICSNKFRRLHDLKRHEKLHTGEKPYECGKCGRKFARADALVRHSNSQTGCALLIESGMSSIKSTPESKRLSSLSIHSDSSNTPAVATKRIKYDTNQWKIGTLPSPHQKGSEIQQKTQESQKLQMDIIKASKSEHDFRLPPVSFQAQQPHISVLTANSINGDGMPKNRAEVLPTETGNKYQNVMNNSHEGSYNTNLNIQPESTVTTSLLSPEVYKYITSLEQRIFLLEGKVNQLTELQSLQLQTQTIQRNLQPSSIHGNLSPNLPNMNFNIPNITSTPMGFIPGVLQNMQLKNNHKENAKTQF